MAKTLQHRRGTTAELASVSGAIGEIFMDTEKNTLVVHDGITGHELVSQDGDAVLNSALVGDVSIVGNSIGGVDSYGNVDTLVVEGDLTVQHGAVSSTLANFIANWTKIATYDGNFHSFNFNANDNWTTSDLDTLLSLSPGTVVSFTNLQTTYGTYNGHFTVVNTSSEIGYYGARITKVYVSNFELYGYGSAYYNNLNINDIYFTWSTTVDSVVNTLSVTSTGVNVEGTLTVNGQEITAGGSGSSYDQSLNTTDDVVFNSALVGDVSIIGNTISGVDSYGNADTLVVDGDFVVKQDTLTTSTQNFGSGGTASYSYSTASGYPEFQFSQQYNGWPTQDLDTLASIQPGTVVQFTNLSTNYGACNGYFTVVSSTKTLDYYGYPLTTIRVSGTTVTAGMSGFEYSNSSVSNINFSWSAITASSVDTLSITSTGVNVTGALTVNGQAITAGGTGASYDQDLNTTDDVVFNSALVGDVSIVGNTVSGVDSYGNPDALVVDGQLSVSFGGSTTTTGSVTINNTTPVNYNGSWIQIAVADGWTQQEVDYFKNMPNGSNITLGPGYSTTWGNYQSGFIVVSNVQILTPDTVNVYVNSMYINTAGVATGTQTYIWSQSWLIDSTTVTVDTTTTMLDVTETGVAVEGNLVPGTDMAYSLGSPTKQWKDLYVSTNTIYIGGTPITVEAGELKVDGVSLIESNYVGSKAITAVAPTLTTTTWSNAFWFEAIATMSQTTQPAPIIEINLGSYYSQEFINDIQSLKAGDIISSDAGNQFTLDGPFVNYGDTGAYLFRAPIVTQTGVIDLYIFENNINFNKLSEQSASFSFAADGNFAAPSILADSALIGDVSITGNTIAGVDSYGLADKLVVDGDLAVDGSIVAGDVAKGQTSVSIKPETFNVIDGVNTSVIKSSTDSTKDQQQVIMKIDASPQRSISWENGSFVYSGRHESYVYGIGAGGSPAIDAYLSQYFDKAAGVPIVKDGTGTLSEEVVTSGGIRLLNSRSVHMEATVIARNTSGASKAWKISGVWTSHGGTPTLMPSSYTSTVLGFDDHFSTGVTTDWAANIEAVPSPNPIGGSWQNLMVKVNAGTDVYFSASISATIIQEIDTVEAGGSGGGGK